MHRTEIKAFQTLLTAPARINAIARKLGLSRVQAYRVVKSLVAAGFAERRGETFVISSSELGVALRRVASRYDISRVLEGAAADVLTSLLEPKKMSDLKKETGLSEDGLNEILGRLQSVGVVSRKGWTYFLTEDEPLQLFVRLLKERKWIAEIEPVAVPLCSDGFIIKKAPRGSHVRGVLTAFSRFKEYGVQYIPTHDYFAYPPTDITPAKVLVRI